MVVFSRMSKSTETGRSKLRLTFESFKHVFIVSTRGLVLGGVGVGWAHSGDQRSKRNDPCSQELVCVT